MKTILAIVRPHILDRLLKKITETKMVESGGVHAVKGYGRQKNYLNEYQGSEYSMAYLPKAMIRLEIADENVDAVVATIIDVARTGRMGDGKIFIV